MNALLIVLAIVVTLLASLIAMPLCALIILSISTWILIRLDEEKRRLFNRILQGMCYALSDFCGLIAGSLFLHKSALLQFFPLLVGAMGASCLMHTLRTTSKVRPQQRITAGDKGANLVGMVVGIVAAYLVVRGWYP